MTVSLTGREMRRGGVDLGTGCGLVGSGQDLRDGRQPHDDDEQDDRNRPSPVRIAGVPVARVEPVPDHDADQEDQRGDDPVELRGERQRIVVRQHQEDDGQRQVVVVQGSGLGDPSVFRVRLPTCLQIGDDDLLVRDDDHEDVGRHDRRGERTEMQERGASGEELRVAPCHCDEHAIENDHQGRVVLPERRLADLVVDDPAQDQRRDRDQDRNRCRYVQHAAIDEEEIRTGIVDDAEQGESREPCGVALPLEPGEVFGQFGRRDQYFWT